MLRLSILPKRFLAALLALIWLAAPLWAERITVNAAAGTSAMPPAISVSTWPFNPMVSPAEQDWFFKNFSPGLIQVDLGNEVFAKSANKADALARARRVAAFARRVEANGGQVMVSISKIPAWLSSSNNGQSVAKGEGTSVAVASPPRDYSEWRGFIGDVVRVFSGLRNLRVRIGWEPDTKVWQGTSQQFFTYYQNTAKAVKAARGGAKVGGPGVSDLGRHWRDSSGPSMLEAFLAHVSKTGAPLDFVAVHGFGTSPWESWDMYAGQVARLLRKAGLNANKPVFIGEWSDQPGPFSPLREESYIAAYMVANMIGMADAGIEMQAYTSMTEQQINESTEFGGGFGLFTRGMVMRPAAIAMKMIDRMGNRRLPVTVADDTVFALASKEGGVTRLLIANFVPDQRIAIKDYADQLRGAGFLNDVLADQLKGAKDLEKLAFGKMDIRGGALGEAHDTAYAQTQARMPNWKSAAKSPKQVTVDISGLAGGAGQIVNIYRIDNSYGVAKNKGRAIDKQINSARASLSDQRKLEALQKAGFSRADIEMTVRTVRAGDKVAALGALSSAQLDQLHGVVATLNGIEASVGLPTARAALEDPATGFAVAQSKSVAGQKSLNFDLQMPPNSVVLIEFGSR
ncbi:MAG: GH39 family glycosyl hydrolase [Mangrovicoccus sp.]